MRKLSAAGTGDRAIFRSRRIVAQLFLAEVEHVVGIDFFDFDLTDARRTIRWEIVVGKTGMTHSRAASLVRVMAGEIAAALIRPVNS